MSFLIHWLGTLVSWCLTLLDKLPLHLWVLVLGGIQDVVNAIPVPGFIGDASNYVAAIPPTVAYFSGALQLKYGLSVVVSAWLARWLLRRIPLIG
jgi:hypothetical protein